MHLRGSLSGRTKIHPTPKSNWVAFLHWWGDSTEWLPWMVGGLVFLLLTLQFPHSIWLVMLLGMLAIRFPKSLTSLTEHPLFLALGGWKTLGILVGVLLFVGISMGADPALAIFDKAEQQASSIFGEYVDGKIITFLFGLLRIVVWITAVGFILFAVYQAQRGEQWQPLMQNAFIVIAAIVVVEGLSAMFFK